MKHLLYIITIALALGSCSEYQKVFRKDDVPAKYALGEQLYNDGKLKKAQRLFEQIVPGYRGKPGAEKLMYMYGNTFYLQEDYVTSAYQLERFVKAYPRSEKLDEMAFKAAKSNYYLSPRSSLDQEDTEKAILKLQNFMNTYPKSEYFKEASDLALEMDTKLQDKAYNIAKGYHHRISSGTQYRDDYYAAITALENFLRDYPGTKYKEKALYYRFDTAFLLAKNSTNRRKKSRIEEAIEYYNKWKKVSTDSEFSEDADENLALITKELENFNTNK